MSRVLLPAALFSLALPLACSSPAAVSADAAPAQEAAPMPDVSIVGVWSYEVASPGGGDSGTFTITDADGGYAGDYNARGGTYPISDIALDGERLSFSFVFQNGPTVNISGTVENGSFSGTADAGSFGAFPMTATLQSE